MTRAQEAGAERGLPCGKSLVATPRSQQTSPALGSDFEGALRDRDLLRAKSLGLSPRPDVLQTRGQPLAPEKLCSWTPLSLPTLQPYTQVSKLIAQPSMFPRPGSWVMPLLPPPPGEVCSPRGDEAHAGCLHAPGPYLHHGIHPHEPARAGPVGPGNTAGGLGCVPRGLASRERGQAPPTRRACPPGQGWRPLPRPQRLPSPHPPLCPVLLRRLKELALAAPPGDAESLGVVCGDCMRRRRGCMCEGGGVICAGEEPVAPNRAALGTHGIWAGQEA